MDKKTTKPTGKNEKTTLQMIIPVEVERTGKEGEYVIIDEGWETIKDIPSKIERDGYIEIIAGTYKRDLETGERHIVEIRSPMKTGNQPIKKRQVENTEIDVRGE